MKRLFRRRKPEARSRSALVPSLPETAPPALLPSATVPDDSLVALSESATLALPQSHRHQLQETYDANYSHYLPFVLRRANRESDEDTIISAEQLIMGRSTLVYAFKRRLIVGNELIRNTGLLFPDEESFTLFKGLRAQARKHRKKSAVVFSEGEAKLVPKNAPVDGEVDTRAHIIPPEFKARGEGLPFYKIGVPYLSAFRKNVPYMVFKRMREVPLPPSAVEGDGDDFESFDFCTTYLKSFHTFKRYTMVFRPEDEPEFTVTVFQHQFRPFTDFVYKNTRFRVVGLALALAYVATYNPDMKLFIIDDSQPLMCDGLLEKNGKPVPNPNNVLFSQENDRSSEHRRFVPKERPPFAHFVDSCAYLKDFHVIPKKYLEMGRIEIYQSVENLGTNTSSTLSVDLDTAVLSAIILALRETGLRTTVRHSLQFSGRITQHLPDPRISTPFYFGVQGTSM